MEFLGLDEICIVLSIRIVSKDIWFLFFFQKRGSRFNFLWEDRFL